MTDVWPLQEVCRDRCVSCGRGVSSEVWSRCPRCVVTGCARCVVTASYTEVWLRGPRCATTEVCHDRATTKP